MPIEKDIGGGGPKKVAEADPMTHMELELMQNLEGGFKEAIKNGFKGTFDEYLDTLSEDDLKTLFLAQGGVVKDPTFTKYSDGGREVDMHIFHEQHLLILKIYPV